MPNLPSEEVFTTPDPERVDGVVRATKPLQLAGATIEGLTVRFEGGRAVEIDADKGADVLRAMTAHDDGAGRAWARSRSSTAAGASARSTPSSTTRCWTRTRPATSRSGRRSRSPSATTDAARINTSMVHIDFMIGGDDVDVTGWPDGRRAQPVLRGGVWQLYSLAPMRPLAVDLVLLRSTAPDLALTSDACWRRAWWSGTAGTASSTSPAPT